MKKILVASLFLIVSQLSFGISPINIGLKAGYTSSKITTSLDQFNDGSVSNFLVGAFARINLGKTYIQPEGYFASKGGVLKNTDKESFDFNTIDVPVLLGYKLIKLPAFNLRINAGPVFSFVTKKDESSNGGEFDADKFKDSYVGVQYGAGVDFLFLSLDARMESSLGDIYSGGGDEKSKIFMVTLGIKFL
jgi:hypothetical protein